MDWILFSGSLVTIAILAFVIHRVFPEKTLGKQAMLDDYQRYNPDAKLDDAIVSVDERSLIVKAITASGNQLGLVRQIGDQLVCRTLVEGDQVNISAGGTLKVSCPDFTAPEFTFALEADALANAEELLVPYTNNQEAAHAI
ncbi:hypothetical protein [Kordiimonas laminariae]|uniref:hypothetical protein n=1 Tax=Kordiimonas laminariae TaxID=2917717 RepID=UPI001FF25E4D|nr:hypothetical protein [Kordiimonas laminariae]MCK0069842.1 hypothetical protein [Kordiimonas laminariae]